MVEEFESWENSASVSLQFFDGESLEDDLHEHGHFELCFVLRGSGQWQMGSRTEGFAPGSLVLCPPRTLHAWISEVGPEGRSKVTALTLRFKGSALPNALLKAPELRRIAELRSKMGVPAIFEVKDRERLQARLRSIGRAQGPLKYARFLVALELVSNFEIRQLIGEEDVAKGSAARDLARLNRVRSYVEGHFSGRISRGAAAREAGLEEAAFSRFFQRAQGQRFVDYVANVRVRQAAVLLGNRRDLSLPEVARRSGFGGVASLHRQFKKWLGTTPDSYRKAANSEMLAP